jgi:hypothetical protein
MSAPRRTKREYRKAQAEATPVNLAWPVWNAMPATLGAALGPENADQLLEGVRATTLTTESAP